MGDAVGACADSMTVTPHRPNTATTIGFLIVQALRGYTGPDDQDTDTYTFYSFWALNSIGMIPKSHEKVDATSRRSPAAVQ